MAKISPGPRVDEGKESQETVGGWKGTGEKHWGSERADRTRNGDGSKAQRRDNIITRSINGKGTAYKKSRVDDENEKKLRMGIWNVCGPRKSVNFGHDTARLHCLLSYQLRSSRELAICECTIA